MKLTRSIAIAGLVAVAAAVIGIPCTAEAQDTSISAMMSEISKLSAEKAKNDKQLKVDLQAYKQGSGRETRNKAKARRVQAEYANEERDANSLLAQYGGKRTGDSWTINCKKSSACRARNSALNSRMQATNARNSALRAATAKRLVQAKAILAKERRNQAIGRQIAHLRHLIAAARAVKAAGTRKSCTASCVHMGKDAAAQCLQSCWDGAHSASSLPTVEQVQRPVFSATRNGSGVVLVPAQTRRRTAQEAIREYKASGVARPGPQTLHIRDVPPPKFH